MKRKPIGKLISLIYRQNQKMISKKLKAYQIGGGGQHSFLIEIVKQPGINQDQLTTELKFDKATTARAIKKLEEAGYITRKIDEKDRRSFQLFPTAKGLEFYPVLMDILKTSNHSLTLQLTDEEKDQLIYLLQKLTFSDHD
ncbi:MarR family transcriptional regulator [Bacillus sp. BRMEA1]|uniref:MarR family winged helix-turn-helix transcriptional regulator n=1 Tax=Neobacillus endophyticus TaxID=2738405 RepID=UPI0015653E50|nr:MarR family transcriptional regulator [Neobacillus endophyticus]NRD79457.1 MarR family transcriptional regulator [Neobacillus endophyticus]